MIACRWDAADYAKSSSAQQAWARELIGKLELQGDERLLDIGCGDGKVTAEIARLLPEGSALGVDSSEAMVALAQSQYPADAHPNLRFQQADARSLPFRDEFDIVFSNATLHWVLDHRPVLRGIAASLKSGGKVLLQMGGRGNAADTTATLDKLMQAPRWRCYFQAFDFPYGFYGPDDYGPWLREAGLVERRVELIPKDMVHPGPEGLTAWIRTTWLGHTQRVPEEERGAFIAEVVQMYIQDHALDQQGLVHVGMVRLEVEATKP